MSLGEYSYKGAVDTKSAPQPAPAPTPAPAPVAEAPKPTPPPAPAATPVPKVTPNPAPAPKPVVKPAPEKEKTDKPDPLETLDGAPIPVLPKRNIPELSQKGGVRPAPPPEPDIQAPEQKAKLNFNEGMGEAMYDKPVEDNDGMSADDRLMIMNMMKDAGFDFSGNDSGAAAAAAAADKPKTYEDTLADL